MEANSPDTSVQEPPDRWSLCRAITEHAPAPMAVLEGATHIVRHVNPAFCRLLEGVEEELVGKPFAEIMPENDECLALLDRVYCPGKPVTHAEPEHPEPGRRVWSYTMWPVMGEEGPVGVVMQVNEAGKLQQKTVAMNEALVLASVRQHELTEAAESLSARLQVEIGARQEALREVSEKARLLDLSFDAIIVRDSEGRITYWNHGAEELYGWPREEVLGKVSHLLLQTRFAVSVEQMTEELHRTNRWIGELVHTKRDGQRVTVLVRKTLDRDSEGNASVVLEYLTDITERKKMEEALREAKIRLAGHAGHLEGLVAERTAELTATNRQLETFVYSIAHDLRAPLRSMQGFSAMLIEEAGAVLSDTGRDYARRIDRSAQFMDAMLRDLLAFGRVSQPHVELEAVSLGPVVASVLSRLQADIQERHASVETSGPWPVVRAHEPTLGQVLFNLTSNALKFVAPGGAALVRLRTDERAENVRVWVEDNGPGIAPDHHAEIFRPFTRLDGEKHPGTGIGLAIVQQGVERMGGQVGVESTPGQGSRFWFELRKA